MQLELSGEKPIFLQIAEGVEDAILSGAFPEEGQVPSITEFSVTYKINPATALKGISLLVDAGILYKKRGLGMFVAPGAREKLTMKRQEAFFETYVLPLTAEAKRLSMSAEELKAMIERGFTYD